LTARLLICALLLLHVPALASAQQTQMELPGLELPGLELPGLELPGLNDYEPPPMYDPTQGTIRLDVEVKDKSGYPVTGLRQQDFTLQDNGRPGTIVTLHAFDAVRARPDPPVEIILVIDELNMQEGLHIQAAADEAEAFLRQNQGHLAQPVSIYRIKRDGPWTGSYSSTDGNALAEEIAHQSTPHVSWKKPNISVHTDPFMNGKPINFNVTASLEVLGSIAIEERRRPGRKLLFWLGPGWRIDRPIKGELIQRSIELCIRMREARIAIWQATEWPSSDDQRNPLPTQDIADTISPEDMESGTSDTRSLTLPAMAIESGGGVLNATDNLFTLIAKRIEEASCFYSLTFDAPRTLQVDEYHDVEVEVGKPYTTVRTRAGYFDEPVYYDQHTPGAVPTTVEQLVNALRAARGASDREVAQQLSRMELTERLNTVRLRALESALPGKKSRQALTALADESVFLAPPAAEILPTAAPDPSRQQEMLLHAIAYVAQNFPRLPNFVAERTTVEYGETPPKPDAAWKTVTGDPTLHARSTTKATMRYRDGKEVVDEEAVARKPRVADTLRTSGVFGPILGIVLVSAMRTHGDLSWSRWEMGPHGPEAVFRYRTTREKNLYFTSSDYLTIDDSVAQSKAYEPFHGEFAIDPASGAILRLTLEADLEPRLPLDRSDIMVEYGPQVLGGRTYICPARSVSISRQRVIMDMHGWSESYKIYAPFGTLLNDVVFDKYHLFQPTVRMLLGFRPAPQIR
jgi:VWFA-related protein